MPRSCWGFMQSSRKQAELLVLVCGYRAASHVALVTNVMHEHMPQQACLFVDVSWLLCCPRMQKDLCAALLGTGLLR